MITLQRTHTGTITLSVNGQPASAAQFTGMATTDKGTVAYFAIPLDKVAFAEADNVVPFVRPQPAG